MQEKLTIAGLACAVLLAGCGEINVKKYLPFGNDAVQERSRAPTNATEYQCAAGKRIYVRNLEGGAAVWLILPERELRLERLGADNSTRYGKGNITLDLGGNAAAIKDGNTIPFLDCKTGVSEPAPTVKP
jgi:membrane-bound inhibitor of C-type lysozyme